MKRSSLHIVWALVAALATLACATATAPASARSPCAAMDMSGSATPSPSGDRPDAMASCMAACVVVAAKLEIAPEPQRVDMASYDAVTPDEPKGAPPSPSTPPPRVADA